MSQGNPGADDAAKAGPPRPPDNGPPAVRAYFEANHLKHLYRRGWLRSGVPPERCESVAEHAFGVALLALLFPDPSIDPLKTLRMALLHDLGEAHAGDVIPADGVPLEVKHREERLGIVSILEGLPEAPALLALYDEYERGESAEARYVRQLDRVEMALQAGVYESQGLGYFGEFIESARGVVGHPALRAVLDSLKRR